MRASKTTGTYFPRALPGSLRAGAEQGAEGLSAHLGGDAMGRQGPWLVLEKMGAIGRPSHSPRLGGVERDSGRVVQ